MPRRRTPPEQLGLFSEEAIAAAPAERPGAALAARFKSLSELAERIPALVRFGTSSWSFPGWGGIVFEPGQSESFLAREGLRAYVLHPLLRTVGIDRGYYSPLLPADLQRYAAQLPAGFPCCAKAPSAGWLTGLFIFDASGIINHLQIVYKSRIGFNIKYQFNPFFRSNPFVTFQLIYKHNEDLRHNEHSLKIPDRKHRHYFLLIYIPVINNISAIVHNL